MPIAGKKFLSAVMAEGSVAGLVSFGSIDHLFMGDEVEIYEFIREFVKKHGALPSSETLWNHLGVELPPVKDPASYHHEVMMDRHIEVVIKKAMKEASDLLMPNMKDPRKGLEILTKAAMELARQRFGAKIVDFRDAYDVIVADYVSKYNEDETYGLRLGWPYLDEKTGGLVKGDLVSFVGRPQKGKTWQMLYAAHHGWQKTAHEAKPQSRLFISMEMSSLLIQQRLAAMQAHVKMTDVKLAQLDSAGWKMLKDGLIEIKGYGAPFWVVDANLTATVEDIAMLCRQLQPDGCFIDGGYLLKHPKENDRFKKVANNCNLIKQDVASQCPTVVSWQFAKTAAAKSKKKGEKPELEDIGYTDAIAQDSSIVVGITEPDNVETLASRQLDLLKGRSGESGGFKTKWNFDHMDFSQLDELSVDDLSYI